MPHVQPGTVLAGRYQINRLLGVGGMGAVVAALDLDSGKLVALKLMLPQALRFPQARQRFEREGAVLSRFRGDHLPRVLDRGMLHDGSLYLALELIDGIDLAKVVRQYGALSVRDAVGFVLQACAAMAQVHALGVVHRDLKPGNLILTQCSSGAPLIKVLDFGLSKILGDDAPAPAPTQTQTTGTMGTPAYMSPEQARSAKLADERSDIWSLGAILFYLLSARLPFSAEATAEAFAKVLYAEPDDLAAAAPWVPRGLVDVVSRCLRKQPDERYQSVDDLARALAPFVGGVAATQTNEDGSSPPVDLDVAAVLQQRTSVSNMASLPIALAETLVNVRVQRPTRSILGATFLAAVAGMITGAFVIIAGLTLVDGDSDAAVPVPGEALVSQHEAEPPSSAPPASLPAVPVAVPVAPEAAPITAPVAAPATAAPAKAAREAPRDNTRPRIKPASKRSKRDLRRRPRTASDPFGTMY